MADRGYLREEVLAERILLAIYGYGTNTGIRSVAGNSHNEDDIRYAAPLPEHGSDAADRDRQRHLVCGR